MIEKKKVIASFKDLIVWQKAYDLSLEVYRATKEFPKEEVYGLTSQMRRAAISVCSNIAEGFGRSSRREKDRFYAMAKGSLTELESQILIAKGIGYVDDIQLELLDQKCIEAQRLLFGLQKANKERSR